MKLRFKVLLLFLLAVFTGVRTTYAWNSPSGYTPVCIYEIKTSGNYDKRTSYLYLYLNTSEYLKNGAEKYTFHFADSASSAQAYNFSMPDKYIGDLSDTKLKSYKSNGCPPTAYSHDGRITGTCFEYKTGDCNNKVMGKSKIESARLLFDVNKIMVAQMKQEVDATITDIGNLDCKDTENIPTLDALKKDVSTRLNSYMQGTISTKNEKVTTTFETSIFYKSADVQGQLNRIEPALQDHKKKCESEIEKDDTLTDEEKEQVMSEIGEKIDTFSSELSNYLKNQLQINIQEKFDGRDDCEGLLGSSTNPDDPAYYVHLILAIMRYAAVALCLILSGVDFFKAIVNQDKDALIKASKTAVLRLVFAVIIFFLPTVIDFILGLLGDSYKLCL